MWGVPFEIEDSAEKDKPSRLGQTSKRNGRSKDQVLSCSPRHSNSCARSYREADPLANNIECHTHSVKGCQRIAADRRTPIPDLEASTPQFTVWHSAATSIRPIGSHSPPPSAGMVGKVALEFPNALHPSLGVQMPVLIWIGVSSDSPQASWSC
ncbi:hypothetical protein N7468_002647 [Penicillium chermesinum]|uniref:Uncharacterized protein n=1 Tax=Penicillium chermesinum TaxID=63820 RepID=A0A9W9PJ42_9EURO|nr:uncharacterized protein N7468_002647 [Penicillium chermesinum]KAJ5247664.1 hypothetical protein N7468_002647 [Penicillium chermesinum]